MCSHVYSRTKIFIEITQSDELQFIIGLVAENGCHGSATVFNTLIKRDVLSRPRWVSSGTKDVYMSYHTTKYFANLVALSP